MSQRPKPHRVRFRTPIVFLLLVLIALPAVAGEQGSHIPKHRSFLASLWQALAGFFPGVAQLGPSLDPLGGGHQEAAGSTGDLGPSLDPLG
jgi:hypothetical protein